MSLSFDTVTQVMLEVPPEIQQQAWQQSRSAATATGKWNIYLNQVCLQTFLRWLQAEYAVTAAVDPTIATIGVWDLLNGTALTVDGKRLVLIPDKTLDVSQFRVPQEWVDIPGWAGDYFLAVQVNPDDSALEIWGYTTHEKLKTQGRYEADDRCYCLDAQDLIPDLSVLWVMQQLGFQEPTQAEIAPLPVLSATEAENLLQQLGDRTLRHPRLQVPFEPWAAFLAHAGWRQQLCQRRQAEPIGDDRTRVNLSQWLQNQFEAGWQAVESWLSPQELAFSFRQTAESETAARRVKVLNLADQSVLLLVVLEPEADGRLGVRVQLRSPDRAQFLPTNLSLMLLSTGGDVVQAVQSREQDNSIQLKRFKCPAGMQFQLRVELSDAVAIEDFQV